jgi:hypothetical protein
MFLFSREMGLFASGCAALAFTMAFSPGNFHAAGSSALHAAPEALPFRAGEKLTYNISWSKVFSAGTAVMEVKGERTSEGRDVLRFVSTARTTGMVDKVYRVRDTVQSVFDPRILTSLSYSLDQSHGKRKRKRGLVFDHGNRTVTYTQDGKQETIDVPANVQDALSSLYYVRTLDEFTEGKPIVVRVCDSGKTWTVEVHVLGREKVKTPVGEFNTIKVKTYPKYEGVFLNKGEIFIWLTDDRRKVPVLMKSTITIGSIVSTLTDMHLGDERQ